MGDNSSFFENEKKYGTGSVQEYIFSLLIEVDEFCKTHRIEYSLSGGTLLGAIRHKGFIPWDDDIDIMFDRKNYTKFLQCSNELPNDLIVTQKIWVKRVTRKGNHNIGSEIGCIDLFVFDAVPDNHLIATIKVFLIQMLQGMMKKKHDYSKYSLKEKILVWGTWIIGLPFSFSFKQRMYDKVSQIGNKKSSKKINIFNTFFNQVKRCKFDSSIVNGYIEVSFENKKFSIINGFDSYLQSLYGNYMELPPEKDRHPAHIRRK